jgi:kinetochore protein Mis13/DSN1
LPHPDIAYDDFHKHIKADFPEPVRMKQLLAWCARRALDEQKAKYASTESSNPAAIGINASLQMLMNSTSNWRGNFTRFD